MNSRIKRIVAAAMPAALAIATTTALVAVPQVAIAKDTAPLKVTDKGAVKGASQIGVAAFNVGFIFESIDATAATGGLIGAFGGATKAKSTLVGVTPEMMQAITDAAYVDFVAQMGAQGIAVAAPATVFGAAEMAKLKPVAGPTDINLALEKGSKGKAQFFKPSALPTQIILPGDFTGSGLSSLGLQMSGAQSAMAVSQYAKASGIPMVDVVYLIDFSDQKRPGAFSFAGIRVNASLSVAAQFSKMTVYGANAKQNSVLFNQPVAVEGEFIEKNDASSGLDKSSQAAANVAGGLAAVAGLGGLRFGKTRKFEFAAKPGNYEEGAAKAASLANAMLVAQVAAAR